MKRAVEGVTVGLGFCGVGCCEGVEGVTGSPFLAHDAIIIMQNSSIEYLIFQIYK